MASQKIKEIADIALARVEDVLTRWLPSGSFQGSEYVALNPTRKDTKKGSFSINRLTGVWSDFAEGKSGSDLVALVAYLEGIKQGEAAKKLSQFLALSVDVSSSIEKTTSKKQPRENWEVIMPVPGEVASSFPRNHYKNGKPSTIWRYLNGSGSLLLVVMRFDLTINGKKGKDYRPLSYCEDRNGNRSWRWQQPKEKRPLYGLRFLSDKPDALVVLAEGEKAAEACQLLLPDYVCMTWPGGSNAVTKADFSPLKGRSVLLWPDNDITGKRCMDQAGNILKKLGCTVRSINLEVFGDGWQEKADAADALDGGFTADKIKALEKAGKLIKQVEEVEESDATSKSVSAFLINKNGVYFRSLNDEGEAALFRICDRLEIVAQTRDQHGREWGRLVRFSDPDGSEKDWNIPSQLLATEGGSEILRQLYSLGLEAEAGQQSRRRLIQYIQSTKTENRYVLVNKLGWHGNAYLLPDGTLGTPFEKLYFYSQIPDLNKISQKGSLNNWRENIAKYSENNPLITFALSSAFAAPLLHLVGMETTGFHFFGDSSQGKTTLLKVAASVYGPPDYVRTWRSTDNALESVAAAHSDGLLILDEISQCDPRIVGDVTYMLGNGKGKSRMNDRGIVRSNGFEWRLLFLSTGERTLHQHMSEAGKTVRAGQEVRLLAVPSDAGSEKGIFNDLHLFAGGDVLSKYLVDKSAQYYGVPFIEFVKQLCAVDHTKLASKIRREIVNFSSTFAEDYSGQVKRAAEKFALVGLAGEMAAEFSITNWRKGEALKAAKTCFDSWLSARGSSGNLEDQQALSQIKLLFEKYGESRFTRWDRDDSTVDDHGVRTMERWGFRKTMEDSNALNDGECFTSSGSACSEVIYYVLQEVFKTEICKGLNLKRVKTLLGECGALERDGAGCYTVATRLPGAGRSPQRVYIVKPHLIL